MARTKAEYIVVMELENDITQKGPRFKSVGPIHPDRKVAKQWLEFNGTAGATYGIQPVPRMARLTEKPAKRFISI